MIPSQKPLDCQHMPERADQPKVTAPVGVLKFPPVDILCGWKNVPTLGRGRPLYHRINWSDPLGPLGSSRSQQRRTLELVLQKSHAQIRLGHSEDVHGVFVPHSACARICRSLQRYNVFIQVERSRYGCALPKDESVGRECGTSVREESVGEGPECRGSTL